MKEIILVDKNDHIIGYETKSFVHQKGLLHRAFSILIFDNSARILLQQRAATKYHSPGLWTNACCSHPLKGSDLEQIIHERLLFEMGFDCMLQKLDSFLYHETLQNGLIEHEYDYVYWGIYEGAITPNVMEVESYCWLEYKELVQKYQFAPDLFTAWFQYLLPKYEQIYHILNSRP